MRSDVERARVGDSPYRVVDLRTPRSAMRSRWFAAVACVATIVGAARAGWNLREPGRLRDRERRALARAIDLAHAGTMASGRQVTILLGEGARAVVVRVPGRLVERGNDLVREVEVLPGCDAVALMPDGDWAIDARGHVVDVASPYRIQQCATRPSVAQSVPGRGRVVQVTAAGRARLEDGSLAGRATSETPDWSVSPRGSRAVDLSDGADADAACVLFDDGRVAWGRDPLPRENQRAAEHFDRTYRFALTDPVQVAWRWNLPHPVQVAWPWNGLLVCARGRRGEAACVTEPAVGIAGPPPRAIHRVELTGAPRAARMAVSSTDLCFVGFDGGLSCVNGPRRDSHLGLVDRDALTLERMRDGVVDVALSDEVGCVRERSGEVRCWGQILRDGGVVRRDAAVDLVGFDAVDRLVAFDDYVCALQRGEVWCWGQPIATHGGWTNDGRPHRLAAGGAVTALVAANSQPFDDRLCVGFGDGSIRCWSDIDFLVLRGGPAEPFLLPSPPPPLHALVGAESTLCGQDDRSRAWCVGLRPSATPTAFHRVPTFDGYERFVSGHGLLCAVRGGDLHCAINEPDGPMTEVAFSGSSEVADREELRRAFRQTPIRRNVLLQSLQQAPDDDRLGLERALVHVVDRRESSNSSHICWLGSNGRVACTLTVERDDGTEYLGDHFVVPDLDDAVEIAVASSGIACARRASGRVACWGRNVDGLLAPGSTDAPRTYRLEELIARAPTR